MNTAPSHVAAIIDLNVTHVHATDDQICYNSVGGSVCGQRMLRHAQKPGHFICTRNGCYNITDDNSKTLLAVTASDAGLFYPICYIPKQWHATFKLSPILHSQNNPTNLAHTSILAYLTT